MGDTPLCHAACYCDEKMISYLIDHGTDPSIHNKSGLTPYMVALRGGKFKNAELLRKYEPNNGELDEN